MHLAAGSATTDGSLNITFAQLALLDPTHGTLIVFDLIIPFFCYWILLALFNCHSDVGTVVSRYEPCLLSNFKQLRSLYWSETGLANKVGSFHTPFASPGG